MNEKNKYKTALQGMYSSALLYDLQQEASEYFADLDFWIKWAAKEGTAVLELGCGTGRIGISLIELGIQYTGMDILEKMLQQFHTKVDWQRFKPRLVQGDIRSFKFDSDFDVILLPYNTFMHMLDNDQARECLNHVKLNLKEDGLFLLDVFNPDLGFLSRQSDTKETKFTYPDNPFGLTETLGYCRYDRATQVNHYYLFHRYVDGTEKDGECSLRQFYPQEMDILLECNGFEIVHKFGKFDESPFESDSQRQIYVCRPA